MTITITLPTHPIGVARLLASLVEPGLLAVAALTGLGPVGQAVVAGAVRMTQNAEITWSRS